VWVVPYLGARPLPQRATPAAEVLALTNNVVQGTDTSPGFLSFVPVMLKSSRVAGHFVERGVFDARMHWARVRGRDLLTGTYKCVGLVVAAVAVAVLLRLALVLAAYSVWRPSA
jgi:hypothetical protein